MIEDRTVEDVNLLADSAEGFQATETIMLAQASVPQQPESGAGAPAPTPAEAIRLTADANNRVELPTDTSLEDIRIDGDNIVLVQLDGSEIIIVGAALNIPTFVLDGFEISREVLVAAFGESGINVAAGPDNTLSATPAAPQGSGANFNDNQSGTLRGDGLGTSGILGDTSGYGGQTGSARNILEGGDDGSGQSPVVTRADRRGAMVESADIAGGVDANPVDVTGTIEFSDVDFGVSRSAEIASRALVSSAFNNPVTLTAGQIQAFLGGFSLQGGIASEPSPESTGKINWIYQLSNAAVDFLGAGDTITLEFVVNIIDGGYTVPTVVTLTVTGTNDAPVITSVAQAGIVTETADNPGGVDANPAAATGIIAFVDVDLSDDPSAAVTSRQVTASTLANGYTLTVGQIDGLLAGFSLDDAALSNFSAGAGSTGWTYRIDNAALDFLGANDVAALAFEVTVADGKGGTARQTVTLTVTGTNDAPVITSAAQAGAVTETADVPGGVDTDPVAATGTIAFSDVDLSDDPSAAVTGRQVTASTLANGYTLTGAQVDGLLAGFSLADAALSNFSAGAGSTGWTYRIDNAALDFLGANDVVTLAFEVTVSDGKGGTARQTVTITVNGTNDAPVITSGEQSNTIRETADGSGRFVEKRIEEYEKPRPDQDADPEAVTGTIAFADVDLSDDPSASVTNREVTRSTLANGYALTGEQIDGLLAGFSLDDAALSNFSAVTGVGSTGWTYRIGNAALDFLGADDVVTLAFEVTVSDGNGGTARQTVTITVTGTNDIPTIVAGDVSEAFDESEGTLVAGGSFAVTDVDISDIVTVSGITVAATGVVTAAPSNAALLAMMSTTPAPVIDGASTTGTVTWSFDSGVDQFDYLAVGETLTLTYTITVSDGKGGAASQNVTLTITGTNDAPVVTTPVVAQIGEFENRTLSLSANSTDGTFTFNDVDLSDTGHTARVVSVAKSGISDGLPSGVVGNFLLKQLLTINTIDKPAGGIPGTVAWTFSAPDATFDYLAKGQTTTLTYTVRIDDLNGGTVDQTVAITVVGTNDRPVFVAGDTARVREIAGTTGSASLDKASGTLVFAEPDRDDIGHSATASLAGASGVTAGLDTSAIESAVTIKSVTKAIDSVVGTVAWSFEAADRIFDYLAAGERLVLTYRVTLDDNENEANSTDTTTIRITITGTNDIPTIVAGDVSEAFDESEGTLVAGGSFAVTDVDISDIVTVSGITVAATGVVTAAPSNAALLAMMSTTPAPVIDGASTTGTVTWSFDSGVDQFDYLAVGETLTLTYTIAVSDGKGGAATQDVTLTITGTNDAPVITSASQAGTVTETPDNPGGTDANPAAAVGTIVFSDVDLSDDPSAEVTNRQMTASTISNGYTLTTARVDGLLAGFSLDDAALSNFSAVTGTGSTGWTYRIGNAALDFLGADDVVTLAFEVTVSDGKGGTARQTVTITVNGTNDIPVISTVGGDRDAATLSENTDAMGNTVATGALLGWASGTLTVSDADLSDVVNATVKSVSASAAVPGLDADALRALLQLSANPAVTLGAERGTLTWTFTGTEPQFDYLGVNESLILTYEIEVTDSANATATRSVTVTIQGSNDTPAISVDALDSAAATLAEDTDWTGLPGSTGALAGAANGTLSVTDLDLSDEVSASVLSLTVSGPVGTHSLAALQAMLSVSTNPVIAAGASRGVIDWSFTGIEPQFDYLANGETLTLTYTIRAADQHGAFDDQIVSVTIAGANDSVTIVNATLAGSVTEAVNESADEVDNVLHTATGTISFSDLDITDVHTVTITPFLGGAGYLGAFTYELVESAGGTGELRWTFSVRDADLDHLEATDILNQSYVVVISDGVTHGTRNVTVTINGAEDNRAPVAVADYLAGVNYHEDAVASINIPSLILANDTDADLDPLRVTQVDATSSLGASVKLVDDDNDGTFDRIEYDPTALVDIQKLAAGATALDTFSYTISDGRGGTSTGTVTIAVEGRNDAPIAVALSGAIGEDDVDAIVFTAQFADVDAGDSHTFLIDTTGTIGSVVNNNDGTFSYRTNGGFQHLGESETATDTFTYTVKDAAGLPSTKTVTVTITGVNDAPVAVADSYTVAEDGTLTASAANGVLANDTDPDGPQKTAVLSSTVAHGTLTLNADGSFTYVPGANFHGVDSFSYRTTDGLTTSDPVTVSINVTSVNDVPVLTNATSSVSYFENTVNGAPQPLSIVSTFVDVDWQTTGFGRLTISPNLPALWAQDRIGIRNEGMGAGQIGLIDEPFAADRVFFGGVEIGTVSGGAGSGHNFEVLFNAAATPAAIEALLASLTFANISNNPTTSRTYTISVTDGDGGTALTTVDIAVVRENDLPAGADKTISTAEDTPVVMTLADFGFTDPDTGAVMAGITINSLPAQGALTLNGQPVLNGAFISAAAISGGQLAFTPTANASGPGHATFQFTVSDTAGGADPVPNTITFDVTPVADAPLVTIVSNDPTPTAMGSEFQVNTFTGGIAQNSPAVAALSNGRFIVTWATREQISAYDMFGQIYNADGSKFGSEFTINATTGGFERFGAVAGLSGGGFIATYSAFPLDGSDYGIFGQLYDATGARVGSEFQINNLVTLGSQYLTSVAELAGGGFVVTWQAQNADANGFGIQARVYNAAGVAQGSEFAVNATASGDQTVPEVAALKGGGFVVSWQSTSGIYAQMFSSAGARVGGEFLVNSNTVGGKSLPDVAALEGGGFVVTWVSTGQDGSSDGVYAQRYAANGAPVGAEFLVTTYVANAQNNPTVIGLADGGFLISWMSAGQDGSGLGIYGQRFSADGSKAGSEFRINGTTAGDQMFDAVGNQIAQLADGSLAATWFGVPAVNGNEIYARTFSLPGKVVALEDTPVPVSAITVALADMDGSETLAVTLSGIPAGMRLTDGNNVFDATAGNQSVNVLGWNLSTLTIQAPLNWNGSFSLTLTAVATETATGQTATTTRTIPVTIDAVNDAPIVVASGGTIAENVAGALVGTFSVTDIDTGTGLTFRVLDGGAVDPRFVVVAAPGTTFGQPGAYQIRLAAGQSVDYESENADGNPSITRTIEVNDGQGANSIATSTFTVAVTDVDEVAPSVVSLTLWPNTINDASAAGADSVTSGLVALYRFDGGAFDSVAGANGSAFNGPSYVAGQMGAAIAFNNFNSFVMVPRANINLPTGAAPRTVAFWADPDTFNENGNMISWGSHQAVGARFSILQEGNNQLRLIGAWRDFDANYTMVDGWQHIAVTLDNGTLTFFVNGVQTASYANTGLNTSSLGDLVFGKNTSDSNSEYWGGKLDDVRIYQRALSAGEIQSLARIPTATLTLTFSETMDTSVMPTVTTNAGTTLTGASGSWTSATTYVVTYKLVDANTEIASVTFNVSGARDLAGNLMTPGIGFTTSPPSRVDTLAPAIGTPAIEGVSGGDTIVNIAEAGGGVTVTVNVTGAATVTIGGVNATNSGGNTWVASLTAVNGANPFEIVATDTAGNRSATNHIFTADLVAPGAPTIDLVAASDSGVSNADNRTNDTTPTIDIAAEAGSVVRLYDGATEIGMAIANGSGVASITVGTALTDGTHNLTAIATDAAGNPSAPSGVLAVTIDTVFLPTETVFAGQQTANQTVAGRQENPGIIALADGGTLVYWEGELAGSWEIIARVYNADGTPRTNEFRVNDQINVHQWTASAAQLDNGNIAFTWYNWNGGATASVKIINVNGGSVVPEFTVPGVTGVNSPSAAALDGGGFVVTFVSGTTVQAQEYSSSGAPVGSLITVAANSGSIVETDALPGGGWVTGWMNNGGGAANAIHLKIFDNAGNGGPTVIVDAGNVTTYEDSGLDITVLANGNFVVSWAGDPGSSNGPRDVYAQLFSAAGAQIGSAQRVNATTADNQYTPQGAALPDGGYLLSWHSSNQDGSGWGVYAQRFDANGIKVGGEFRLNEMTTGNQILGNYGRDGLAVLGDGTVVVAYTDNSGGTNDIAIRSFTLASGPAVAFTDANGELSVSEIGAVGFTVAGLPADLHTAIATFSDGTTSVDITITGNGAFVADLSALTYGTITVSISATDTAGNSGSFGGLASILYVDTLPVAADDTFSVNEDSPAIAINVLDNDSGPTKTIISVTQPANGVVSITGGGTGLSFQPNANYAGDTTFTYTLNGGSIGNVTVNVLPINDAPATPVDTNPAADRIIENAAVGTVVGITVNASDIDSANITYSLVNDADGRFAIDPVTGVVTVAGAIDYEQATSHTIRVRASDGSLGSEQDFVIAVQNVHNGLGDGGFETTNVGSPFYVYAPSNPYWTFAGTAGNGTGLQNNGSAFGAPTTTNGGRTAFIQSTTSLSQTMELEAGTYSLTLQAAGRNAYLGANPVKVFVDNVEVGSFTPTVNVWGDVTINFTIATAGTHTLRFTGQTSGDATTFIDRVGLFSGDRAAVLTEDAGVNGSGNLVASGTLVVNDAEPADVAFVAQTTTTARGATFTLDANGAWTYSIPNGQANVQGLGNGAKLIDTVTAVTADGSRMPVRIEVNGVNDAPTGANITYTLSEDARGFFYLALSAIDPDSSGFTYSNLQRLSGPNVGTSSLGPANDNDPSTFDISMGNNFEYLKAGETVQAVYSYTVSDGQATGTGSVTVTITGVNDAPVLRATASTVTVNNPGFEANTVPNTTTGTQSYYVPAAPQGWTLTGLGGYTDPAPFGPGASGNTLYQMDADNGTNLMFLETAATLSQTLAQTAEAGTYVLTVEYADAANRPGRPEFAVRLYAGSTLLGEQSHPAVATINNNVWQTDTVSVTIPAGSSAIGQPLRIELVNLATTGTTQILFDNVNLSFDPLPVSFATISEDAASSSVQTVASLLGNSVTDVDTGAVEGIAVHTVNAANGTWQYYNGTQWVAFGAVSTTSALLLAATDQVRFVPNGIAGGTATFDFYAWDQTSGAAYGTANVTTRGGTTAFSSDSGQATIVTTDVNDAPTLTGLDGVTFLENTVNAAAQIIDANVVFGDVDSANLDGGSLTVSGFVSGEDTIGLNLGGAITVSSNQVRYNGQHIGNVSGGTGSTPFTVTFNTFATPAAVDALIQNLTYANSSNTPTPARTLTISVTDGDGGSVSATSTINVTPESDGNAPPQFATPSTSVTITEDTPSTRLPGYGLMGVSGVVSYSDDNGAGSFGGWGVVSTTTTGGAALPGAIASNIFGTYSSTSTTVSWSFDALMSDFQYLNTGQSVTYTYRLTVTDGVNSPATQHLLSITIQGADDVPLATASNDTISLVPSGWTWLADNGHIYKYFSGNSFWTGAVTSAASQIAGQSYLATVTGAAEDALIDTLVAGNRAHLGGSDEAAEGTWKWVTGPEAGQVFWIGGTAGTAQNGAFTNWSSGNPGNMSGFGSEEDYLATDVSNNWNDVDENNSGLPSIGYVAEAGGLNGQTYAAINEDAAFTFSQSWLLANDANAPAAIQSVSATSSKGAAVSYNATTGEITYDPRGSATLQALATGQTTTDTFTYTINNGQGGTSTATVTVNVAGANEVQTVSNLQVTESTISFTVADPDTSTFTLNPTGWQTHFSNPTLTTGLNTFNINAWVTGTAGINDLSAPFNIVGGGSTVTPFMLTIGDDTSGQFRTGIEGFINIMYGFGQADLLTGSSGNDYLFGGNDNDTLNGSAGADVLNGGNGVDTLTGGTGADTLTGGNGNDTFRFASGDTAVTIGGSGSNGTISGYDTITDFAVNNDKLDFTTAPVVATATAGSVAGTASTLDTGHGVVTHHTIANGGIAFYTGGTLVNIDTTGKLAAVVQYLQNNDIGAAGSVVAFTTSTGARFVYQQVGATPNPANDLLIQIQNGFAGTVSSLIGTTIDPIVLDLNGDGLNLAHASGFDLDNDGEADSIGWPTGGDALLVADLDRSGAIENGSEVFSPNFNGGGFADSIEALRSFDANGDGRIDASDATFGDVKVWVDGNGDGISDEGELIALADAGIAAIKLDARATDYVVDGQHVFAEGSFEFEDGTAGEYFGLNFGVTAAGVDVGSGTDDAGAFFVDQSLLANTDLAITDLIVDFGSGEGDVIDLEALLPDAGGNGQGAVVFDIDIAGSGTYQVASGDVLPDPGTLQILVDDQSHAATSI